MTTTTDGQPPDVALQDNDGEDVRSHNLWAVRELMYDMSPEDLTTAELVSMVAIMIPAHSRVLDDRAERGRPNATILQFVPRGDSQAVADVLELEDD